MLIVLHRKYQSNPDKLKQSQLKGSGKNILQIKTNNTVFSKKKLLYTKWVETGELTLEY